MRSGRAAGIEVRGPSVPSFAFLVALIVFAGPARAQQQESYDYWADDRDMIRHGVQAILMCNGLFTSNRTLEQVFEQELAYLDSPRFGGAIGTARGGDYEIDRARRAVARR